MSSLLWLLAAGASAGVGYINPLPQIGEPNYRAEPQHNLRINLENDSFFDNDRNYSHSTRFDYAQQLNNGNFWGISLTQSIYTPETNRNFTPIGEHPYAGHLALGAAYMTTGKNFATSTEFQLGTTGKPSFAQDAQWLIHELGNMYQWDGWYDQIPAEVTMQMYARQDLRLPWFETRTQSGWETDAMAFAREEIGTVSMRFGTGVSFRLGKNLPQRMRNTTAKGANYGVGLLHKESYDPSRLAYFVQFAAYGEYVAHDLFVDGGVFHPFNTTVSRCPWQGELQLGLGVSYQGIDYYLGGVLRSRAYRTQDANDAYGTFTIGWNW